MMKTDRQKVKEFAEATAKSPDLSSVSAKDIDIFTL